MPRAEIDEGLNVGLNARCRRRVRNIIDFLHFGRRAIILLGLGRTGGQKKSRSQCNAFHISLLGRREF